MPNIVVQLAKGRTQEQKRDLGKAIAHGVFNAFGLPASRVNIYFDECEHYKDGVLSPEDQDDQ